MQKIAIIGGGPAGLIAAIMCAKNNDVTIIEGNSNVAKKLLLTGNGHCNYWNLDQSLSHYHSTNEEYLSKIITKENILTIMNFFNKLGIIPHIKNGYYYPSSNQSTSIKNALVYEAKRLNVSFLTNFFVESLKKDQDKFLISSKDATFQADIVILATGSLATPKTGSTGMGYKLLESFHHTIIRPLPSLVQVKTKMNLKDLDGVRTNASLSLYEDNNFIREESGELQLKKDGLSGICTFNLSYYIAKGLATNKEEVIKINFLPFLKYLDSNKIFTWFASGNEMMSNPPITHLLETILNYKIVNYILKKLKIKPDTPWNNLNYKQQKNLIENLLSFEVKISATNSFENSQACSGGLPLTEINIPTFESKLVKNLYVVGELLDVVGDCGGYNLSFAWLSGYLAGRSIGEL